MEEKRKDAVAQPAATPPRLPETAEAEAPSSRRRGQKRKASNNNSGSASTPQTASSKRHARDKPPAIPFPPIHNGPCTRARLTPNTAVAAAAAESASAVASSDAVVKSEAEVLPATRGGEALEALETKDEAQYEAIRSRDANAHVVPIPCGWFSWANIHPLEKQTLPSFFSGKSEKRTPEIYMEIRNWLMKRFHLNPNMQIELKDLSELSVGELEARQEVMEFLDYWGLINYHPLLDTDSTMDNADEDGAAKPNTLLDKLYSFGVEQSFAPFLPRPNAATPAMPSGLFPDSAITEDSSKSEGPHVEYHCNFCSADCSRKRYHCQKQADFDLCSECFSNGKFGFNTSPSDFILMEPAEAPGISGGKWTDQETLLLLEALELYKENWNEIAEHVATKTKAQCILHFVQMPIEDSFLDFDDEIDASVKERSDPVLTNADSSPPKDALETMQTKTGANEDQTLSTSVKTSKPEDAAVVKVDQEASENCALKALREAFEAVGSLPKPGERFSFSEAGNPVMALAAFLVHMVDPNVATASVHNSLKSVSGNSSGIHLAARHCFFLEDPPDDDEKSPETDRALVETTGQDAQKDENQNCEIPNEEKSKSGLDGTDLPNDCKNEGIKDFVGEQKEQLVFPSDECTDKPNIAKEADIVVTSDDGKPGILNESENSHLPKDQPPIEKEESDSPVSPSELPVKDSVETSVGEPSQGAVPSKDENMVSDSLPSDKKELDHPVTSNVVDSGATTGEEEATDDKTIDKKPSGTKSDLDFDKIKRAAVTAISGAAVKAKLLANQEEDQIRQLASLLIEKQLHKLETKFVFFNEMENVVMRVREQLERSRQRLYHERAQIIAARLGLPASSRPVQQPLPVNRVAMSFANSAPKPPMSMTSQRPPIARPMMTSLPPSNAFIPATMAGNSVRPPNQDKLSSVGTK